MTSQLHEFLKSQKPEKKEPEKLYTREQWEAKKKAVLEMWPRKKDGN